MMNKINNILICVLWLLAVTLGATFWFNTHVGGFNIFSAQHWQHVAKMQAAGQPIMPIFYISIIVIVLIAISGLYVLLQPRFRQITLPVFDRSAQPPVQTYKTDVITTTTQSETKPTVVEQPQPDSVTQPQIARPPRLNIPNIPHTITPHIPLTSASTPGTHNESKFADIRKIFESMGYVYKGAPRIKNVQTSLVAIGTNEVLWIGAVGIKNTDMQRAVQTLSGIFSDTLDDIEIHINAFVVAAPDATDAPTDILQFATLDDLRNYITEIPNTPPDAEESENFDAYSGYIGTVIDYIGKI